MTLEMTPAGFLPAEYPSDQAGELRIDEELFPRASLDACVKCTICETQCPVFRVTDLFAGPKYSGPQSERFRKGGQHVDASIDYCSSCSTCTLVCPQGVKVAEMIHHARTEMKKENGIPLRDRLISRTTLMGAVMTPVAPIANWALTVKPIRYAVEKVIGIHRNAPMPVADGRTFEGWFKKHTPHPNSGKRGQQVIFFHGCAGEYFEVETSIHSVEVLEYLGFEVLVPHHGCCGLALQSNGLYDDSRKYVSKLTKALRSANRDALIISSSGSCAGMMRHEAKEVLGVDDPELEDVGNRMRDICEFLVELADNDDLPELGRVPDVTIPYHAPCQLKSQGLGKPALELMNMVPGVTAIDSDQPCCGIAGTYGLKAEKYDIAQAVGQPVFDFIKETNPNLAACDTETCRWQLRTGSGASVVHPIWLIHKSYGLNTNTAAADALA